VTSCSDNSSQSAVFRTFADKIKTFTILSYPLNHAFCSAAWCIQTTGYRHTHTHTHTIYNIHCLATAKIIINFTFQCFSCLVPSCRTAGSECALWSLEGFQLSALLEQEVAWVTRHKAGSRETISCCLHNHIGRCRSLRVSKDTATYCSNCRSTPALISYCWYQIYRANEV
jgi:hypothetical protein